MAVSVSSPSPVRATRIYLTALLIGVTVGAVATVFRLALERGIAWHGWVVSMLNDGWGMPAWLVSVLLSMALFGLAAWLVYRWAPDAGGSGIPEVSAALAGARAAPYCARLLPVKFIGGVLALGAGGVLGREGPTVHIGAALGQWLGERGRLSVPELKMALALGAGTGLAAAFNAPLAGVLFVFEELSETCERSLELLYGLLLACGIGVLVENALLGGGPLLPLPQYPQAPLPELLLLVLLGALLGLLGAVFNTVLLNILDLAEAWRRRFGLLSVPLLVGGGLGLLLVVWPDVVGDGESLVRSLAMQPGQWPLALLMALMTVRTVTLLFSYGAGTPGGLFMPLLALGAVAGLVFAALLQHMGLTPATLPGVFVVAGMAALLVASLRAPLTALLLVTELTGNYELMPALLAACVPALLVAWALGGQPLYRQLLARSLNRVDLRPHGPGLREYWRLDPLQRRRWLLERARH